ncbi:hypothetical protein E2C01_030901 [Portunus trituberculatus]|uniref:Uncharacterized protein n=1 Tax=Portunus trituberculatus TaxID=210409 RepID=A0A5B7EX36_PORTR|nr:hypothetical protein [Portunus trituberculatus]
MREHEKLLKVYKKQEEKEENKKQGAGAEERVRSVTEASRNQSQRGRMMTNTIRSCIRSLASKEKEDKARKEDEEEEEREMKNRRKTDALSSQISLAV